MAHLERLLKDDDLEKASEEEDGCGLKLLDAATSGDEATVSSLLSRQHVQSFINFTDENFCYANDINRGCTPLHFAAAGGHGKVVETLVEAKADLFVQDENQHTPLHLAVGCCCGVRPPPSCLHLTTHTLLTQQLAPRTSVTRSAQGLRRAVG